MTISVKVDLFQILFFWSIIGFRGQTATVILFKFGMNGIGILESISANFY